jgi:acyl-CoA synthetase (AMP-forming)/AMP-acid ligase II
MADRPVARAAARPARSGVRVPGMPAAAEYIIGYTFLTMRPARVLRTVTKVGSAGWQQGDGRGHVGSSSHTAQLTVTQRLLETAVQYGGRTALVTGQSEEPYSFAALASTIRRAAAGLAWRGLQPRDVVGVYVPDAAAYVLACHAISVAGGIPCPLSAELSIAETAGQLADSGARMLITAQPLATAGIAAADRSWVRQVISFGEAPAATPFSSLLGMGSLEPSVTRPHDLALLPYIRRPDGALHPAGLTHLELAAELAALRVTDDISDQDVVLAAPPAGDGRSYTAFIDHALLHGATIVAAATDELSVAATEHRGTAAIVPLGAEVHWAAPLRLFAVA